jgi:acyl-CoA thioester hydrolase
MRKVKESRWFAEHEMTVQFYDLDPMEIVWHGNYVKYLEVVRCALLDKIDYNYLQMKESGYAWPVVDMRLRYVAPATFGQKIRLRADIVEWENCLKIDYLVTDAATGKRLNRATTTMVAVDMASNEMCFVSPPVLMKKLGIREEPACIPAPTRT